MCDSLSAQIAIAKEWFYACETFSIRRSVPYSVLVAMLTDAAELGIPDIVAAREDLAPWDVIPVLLDELYKKVKFSAEADDDYPGVGFYYANNGIYMWSFDRADFLS